MIETGSYLLDTNILLRMSRGAISGELIVDRAVESLAARTALYVTHQNVAEFWNVSTRPVGRNGFGLTPVEAEVTVSAIEQRVRLVIESIDVYWEWRRLVRTHSVSGVQVHDARLAAAMLVHRIPNILTLNTADFQRYPGITAVHPGEV